MTRNVSVRTRLASGAGPSTRESNDIFKVNEGDVWRKFARQPKARAQFRSGMGCPSAAVRICQSPAR